MRWIKFILSLLLTVALVWGLSTPYGAVTFATGKFINPFSGFWQNGKTMALASENLNFPALKAKVEVIYEERGVPHIFAQNTADLYFAQGYVTARDRLWQMDFQIRAATGSLSEVVGRNTLGFDRMRRRQGIPWAAQKALKEMMASPHTAEAVNSYTAGINAYIASLSVKDYPIEFKLLNYEPEPWTPFKSAALLKYMANMLSFGRGEMPRTYALKLWGKETLQLLYPARPYQEDPIIPAGTAWGFEGNKTIKIDTAYHPENLLTAGDPDPLAPQPPVGSNNWAVHGSRSLSGVPLLANDPHLGLSLPSIWYEIQLHTPDDDVYGVSLPGAPAIIIGFNDSIAWGQTNSSRDVVDYYKITYKDDSREEYKSPSGWTKTTRTIDTIRIKGGNFVLDTLIFTELGPVMYDKGFTGKFDTPLACRWMAHEPSNELLAIILLNKAHNHSDYRKAISHFDCPGQNFVFASVSGDIAITQAGRYIARWKNQGPYVLDAAEATHYWQAFIPAEHNPHVLNPERGFVSSANQLPTDSTYPYTYNTDPHLFEEFRNRRINNLLTENDSLTVAEMKQFQQDNFSVYAADILPILFQYLDSTKLSTNEWRVLEMLKTWDYKYEMKASAPIAFDIWWGLLYETIWDDEFSAAKYRVRSPDMATTIRLLRDSAEFLFFDNTETSRIENREILINASFRAATDSIYKYNPDPQKWGWANYKNTRIRHLARIGDFSRDHIPIGGNSGILNATSSHWGPSWRMVVKMDRIPEAWGVYPGGQSGDPTDPQYDNFVSDWAAGNYYKLIRMSSPNDGSVPSPRKLIISN